jgi:hypothetical protein
VPGPGRLSTIERYAAAVGLEVDPVIREPVTAVGTSMVARRNGDRTILGALMAADRWCDKRDVSRR